MEILWGAKAPRADIYSQFVSVLRTAAGASSADRVGRDPCVPPGSTHCSRRGTRAPPYRVRRSHGADRVVRPYTFCAGRRGRRPLHTLSLRASPQTGAAIRFSSARPLDKPVGMSIIINTRGRCIRRSVPVSLKLYLDLNDPQKPSPCPVAVFAFQSLDSYRDRMTQNMNRKHEKHTVPPPFEEVTNRLTMYAASLGRVYTAGGFLSNIGGTHVSRREVRIAPGGARGPRPTGCGGRMGRTGSFAHTRFVWDVGDAVPYAPCHCKPVRAAKQVPLGYRLARQSVFPALAPLTNPPGWV